MIYFGQHAHLSRFPEPPSKKIIVGQNRCLVCISYYPKDTQTTLNVQTGKLMCPTPRMVRGIAASCSGVRRHSGRNRETALCGAGGRNIIYNI